MSRILTTLFLSAVTILAVSCGGGSSTAGEMASVMDEISEVLDGVKTVDDAKAARTELEPLVGRLGKLQKAAAENAGDAEAIDADAAEEIAAATTRYSEAMTRVLSAPELAEHLAEVLTP